MDISEQDYQQAVKAVRDSVSGSVSKLQRKLGWGYSRAAAAIDRMQEEFIVSPMSASGRRDVYPSCIHQLWKELQEAKGHTVPEGFVLFPKEPTQELFRTFYDSFNSANAGNTAQNFKAGFSAMVELQAAKTQVVAEQTLEKEKFATPGSSDFTDDVIEMPKNVVSKDKNDSSKPNLIGELKYTQGESCTQCGHGEAVIQSTAVTGGEFSFMTGDSVTCSKCGHTGEMNADGEDSDIWWHEKETDSEMELSSDHGGQIHE